LIEDRALVSPAEAVINVDLKEQTAQVLRTLTPREEKMSASSPRFAARTTASSSLVAASAGIEGCSSYGSERGHIRAVLHVIPAIPTCDS
jgi:hypothetical protein